MTYFRFAPRAWAALTMATGLLLASTFAMPSMAAPANTVTSADIARVEQEWLVDQPRAIESLIALEAKLEKYGKSDTAANRPNIYWLHARAAYASTQDCPTAFIALTQASTLNFLDHWPAREKAYQELATQLIKCLPPDRRTALLTETVNQLSQSALRPWVSPTMAKQSGLLNEVPKNEGSDEVTSSKSQAQDNSSDNESMASKLDKFVSMAIYAFAILIVMGTIFSLKSYAEGGSPGSTPGPSSTESSKPAKSTGNSKPTTRVTGGARDLRPPKKNRKGLERLMPWK